MKDLIKQLAGFILMLAFIWATTGITVYSHYCSKSDSVSKSLFLKDAECGHHDEEIQKQSCCSEKISCHSEGDNTNCCVTQKQVFRLASSFDIPGEKQKIKIVDFKLLNYNVLQVEGQKVFTCDYYNNIDKPPPETYGKRLVIAIRQQKIAPAPIV